MGHVPGQDDAAARRRRPAARRQRHRRRHRARPGTATGSNRASPCAWSRTPYPAKAPARGLLTGMSGMAWPTFALSCDVPALEPAVLSLLRDDLHNRDAAVPVIGGVPQPLVALYRAPALVTVLERQLAHGERSLLAALDHLHVEWVHESRLRHADPHLLSFRGVNTPAELEALEDAFRGARLDR
ncbi:MAG: NTP transferase domain-containing protein [Dehalococcoidia bacterium]|nr:NTP transferase domain-containing protein [Dehalococcoidia bacterium]